jgi:hypothetical protein
MQQNNGSSQEFKPRVGVLLYGQQTGSELADLENQTYIASVVRSSTDRDSFLATLNELANLVEIVAFFKGGSSWNGTRLAEIVEAFKFDASSIGVVYTDYEGIFNQSFSVRHLTNPNLLKGDIAISSVSLNQKQIQPPTEIDSAFFHSLVHAISASHISYHIPKVLGKWT